MPRRILLLVTLVASVFVIPTWTAPVPMKKPIKEITNSIDMKLVRIPAGQFMMGSPAAELGRNADELQHEVKITKPFHMSAYPVTQGQYEKVMSENPSLFSPEGGGKDDVKGKDTSKFPVEGVTWDEAILFCKRLAQLKEEKVAKRRYRLPTEAEWEYACRAGTKTRFHCGDSEIDLKKADWYHENSDGRTHEAGSKKPNAWGLYDLHGNVFQWCADWYSADYYQRSPLRNPAGPEKGTKRILRGGSWPYRANVCRAANRFEFDPYHRESFVGFRIVCVPSGK